MMDHVAELKEQLREREKKLSQLQADVYHLTRLLEAAQKRMKDQDAILDILCVEQLSSSFREDDFTYARRPRGKKLNDLKGELFTYFAHHTISKSGAININGRDLELRSAIYFYDWLGQAIGYLQKS